MRWEEFPYSAELPQYAQFDDDYLFIFSSSLNKTPRTLAEHWNFLGTQENMENNGN